MLCMDEMVRARVINLGDKFSIDYVYSTWRHIVETLAEGCTRISTGDHGCHVWLKYR